MPWKKDDFGFRSKLLLVDTFEATRNLLDSSLRRPKQKHISLSVFSDLFRKRLSSPLPLQKPKAAFR
ncbi:hypothetical protein L596_007075 [Steinernema carpocapsae]|uniref:Uncharacterized protein n=1 Tax=Steinernema carpocapsae TaxID=34508 RepID=A0A4U5P848_STECR|nr:hypothetical protein L596_007075 [Steinernema carpocapsae]